MRVPGSLSKKLESEYKNFGSVDIQQHEASTEYNEKRHLETVREEGIEAGENRIKRLAGALDRAGRGSELIGALQDDRKLRTLYTEFGIQ